MAKVGRILIYIAAGALLLFGERGSYAQVPVFHYSSDYVAKGDSLHLQYRFEEAVEAYKFARRIARTDADNLLSDARILTAQNAISMTADAVEPVVIASQRFSKDEFFLYFPFPEGSWHPSPGARSEFLPPGASERYFTDGGIMFSRLRDSLWTRPRKIISTDGAIYPMRCSDRLYFASDSLYGMGGYDLYVSHLDAETMRWSEPENLGFPFSSTGNDYLIMDTADGAYTIFASDRDCPKDSVAVYVVEQESSRARKHFTSASERRRVASMKVLSDPLRMDYSSLGGSASSDDGSLTREYRALSARKKALRDSVNVYMAAIDGSGGLVLKVLSERLQNFRDSLADASSELRKVEMKFLRSGVVPDFSEMERAAKRKVVGADAGYTFSEAALGGPLEIKYESELEPALSPYPIERAPDKKWWEGTSE